MWRDEFGEVHFEIPEELMGLYEAEKLLIQMLSPYIPLVHIKNGTLGLKGHVCSFPQALKDVIVELPKLPKDVDMVRLIRNYADKEGTVKSKYFTVRREKVMEALRWLVKHNDIYRQYVRVVEDNLSWMGEAEEAELPSVIDAKQAEESKEPVDEGPAKQQCTREESGKRSSHILAIIMYIMISNIICMYS